MSYEVEDEWDEEESDEEDEWEDEEDEDSEEDEEPSEDREEETPEEENEEHPREEDEEFFDEEDDLISEASEERGGYIHLRYRDKLGRFASPDTDPERKSDIEMDRKINKFLRDYRKKVLLPYNEKILLLRMVDDFKDKEKITDEKGFLNPKIEHFPRLPYHQVFLDFSNSHSRHLKRSAFSLFVKRMIDEGLIEKIKHGKKLYLKITEKGLDRAFRFWQEYSGESWREP